jgi:hypothetical protein
MKAPRLLQSRYGFSLQLENRLFSFMLRLCILCVGISGATTAFAATFTGSVSGNLFYNDMRYYGCHKWRFDRSGDPGERDSLAAKPSGSHDESARNWLGAYDVRVEVYEKEIIGKTLVGTDRVGRDGSWCVNYSDLGGGLFEGSELELIVKFILEVDVVDRAFRVAADGASGATYEYEHPAASTDSPLKIDSGGANKITDAYFGGTAQSFDDLHAQAAMVFASIVEVTRVVFEGDRWDYDSDSLSFGAATKVPFREAEHGEVKVVFPKVGGSGTGWAADELWIGNPGSGDTYARWTNGGLHMHEFGHVINQRAWETGYGFDEDDTVFQSWSASSYEIPLISFKEAWANFVQSATMQENGEDHSVLNDASFDYYDRASSSGRPYGNPDEGHLYAGNVSWFLYDWADSGIEDPDDERGEGDAFSASLYSMWLNLTGMWDEASNAEKEDGLGILDFIDYYLNERKGISEVGASEHYRFTGLITSMAYHNGIEGGPELPGGHGTPKSTNEQEVELSPFGRYSFESTFYSMTDVDSFLFASDTSGPLRIRVTDGGDGELDPAATLWRLDPDEFIHNFRDSSESDDDDVVETVDYTAGESWQINAYPEFEDIIESIKDYTLIIEAAAPVIYNLSLDRIHVGVFASEGSVPAYVKVIAPRFVNKVTARLVASGGADGVVSLYDSRGELLSRVDSAGDDETEILSSEEINGGQVYYLRLGSKGLAPGELTLRVFFGSSFAGSDETDLDADGIADEFEAEIIDADPDDGIVSLGDVNADEDFNKDGINNGLAYALGISGVNAPTPGQRAYLPRLTISGDNINLAFSLPLELPHGVGLSVSLRESLDATASEVIASLIGETGELIAPIGYTLDESLTDRREVSIDWRLEDARGFVTLEVAFP